LNSGALKHIHLQSQEVLIRHLMHHVNAKVQAYQAELASAGERKCAQWKRRFRRDSKR